MIKYSIIVPVYNGEKYLKNCIDSILNQNTDIPFELILVDDGSVDNSVDICREYEAEFEYVKYIHKENGGAASARNIGIDAATGEYIIFIDNDDTIEHSLLQDVDVLIEAADMVVYGMSFDYYAGDRMTRNEILSVKHSGVIGVNEICNEFEDYFHDNALSSACNKVFRSEIIKGNGIRFKEGMTLYEDFEFVIRYLMHSDRVAFIDKAYYHYRLFNGTGNLASRVSDIQKLKANMGMLVDSINDLAIKAGVTEVGSFGRKLYLDMLNSHFSLNDCDAGDIATDTEFYLSGIDRFMDYAIKDERSRWLLEERYEEYYHDLRKRKRKTSAKKMIKRIIGK